MPQTKSQNDALANAVSLLAKLKQSRQEFEDWNERQSEDLPERRQAWLRCSPISNAFAIRNIPSTTSTNWAMPN